MIPIWSNVAALAVAVIFYVYRAYAQVQDRKQRNLRERVAYMLWVMADDKGHSTKTMSVICRGI